MCVCLGFDDSSSVLVLISLCLSRCEENCLSCSGPGTTCTKCKEGYSLVSRTCVVNASCNNGEFEIVTHQSASFTSGRCCAPVLPVLEELCERPPCSFFSPMTPHFCALFFTSSIIYLIYFMFG